MIYGFSAVYNSCKFSKLRIFIYLLRKIQILCSSGSWKILLNNKITNFQEYNVLSIWIVGEQQHFFSGLHSLWQGNSIKAPCMLFQIIVSNLCWCCVFVLNQNVWDILKLSCPCKQVWLANTVIAIVVCGNWLNQYVLNYCCNSLWFPALMVLSFYCRYFSQNKLSNATVHPDAFRNLTSLTIL